ncbi:MAG: hypothetical protein COX29_01675 [Candidatus Moranbacteria bacterium CG23_combo_of_CG06-09_8_20_14_all_35_22]|nr:MAG: hypothetical protein COX29_01675 [Candidatus Moranbacteria bacterium CG23_combo_of_CG06-09_8_20_14_all_35_22]
MKIYQTKTRKLPGTNWREVSGPAFGQYQQIKRKTKRRPYIRSAYFKKDKIFLELFWHHLYEKENFRDKIRRMKFFPATVELIQNSKIDPESINNPNKSSEILHRFTGVTKDSELFLVQIKEEKKSGKKWLMSVFPKKS